jgi:hypothetical protein
MIFVITGYVVTLNLGIVSYLGFRASVLMF